MRREIKIGVLYVSPFPSFFLTKQKTKIKNFKFENNTAPLWCVLNAPERSVNL